MTETLFDTDVGTLEYIMRNEAAIRTLTIAPEVIELSANLIVAKNMWADGKLDEDGLRSTIAATVAAAVLVGLDKNGC